MPLLLFVKPFTTHHSTCTSSLAVSLAMMRARPTRNSPSNSSSSTNRSCPGSTATLCCTASSFSRILFTFVRAALNTWSLSSTPVTSLMSASFCSGGSSCRCLLCASSLFHSFVVFSSVSPGWHTVVDPFSDFCGMWGRAKRHASFSQINPHSSGIPCSKLRTESALASGGLGNTEGMVGQMSLVVCVS